MRCTVRQNLRCLMLSLSCCVLALPGCGGGSAEPEATDAASEIATDAAPAEDAAAEPTIGEKIAGAGQALGAAVDAKIDEVDMKLDNLQAKLDEKLAQSQIPDDIRQVFKTAIDDLKATGIEASALNEGDQAFDFSLPNATGNEIQLSDLYAKGPVVLTWYRGGWCPYCNISLQAMQQALPAIQSAGGTLVAVTPETPDNTLTTTEKNELKFIVLSDAGNQIASEYGLVFKLADAVSPLYKRFGIDLEATNGTDSDELPLAATYVIDATGKIRWAFLDADYTKRAEPADVVEALKAL
ncbi:MAG: peroxiredoxin-like family protein [Planctomycetota bacterium]